VHHTLVVANRTASTPDLLAEVERRAGERLTAFTLLVPEAPKDWALKEALAALLRAARGPTGLRTAQVDGRVTARDPFEAVREALAEGEFDDVLISTLPARRSVWLRRDLPRRVQDLGVPVTVVTEPKEQRMRLEDLGFGGGGFQA
jgi:hypothetical protein